MQVPCPQLYSLPRLHLFPLCSIPRGTSFPVTFASPGTLFSVILSSPGSFPQLYSLPRVHLPQLYSHPQVRFPQLFSLPLVHLPHLYSRPQVRFPSYIPSHGYIFPSYNLSRGTLPPVIFLPLGTSSPVRFSSPRTLSSVIFAPPGTNFLVLFPTLSTSSPGIFRPQGTFSIVIFPALGRSLQNFSLPEVRFPELFFRHDTYSQDNLCRPSTFFAVAFPPLVSSYPFILCSQVRFFLGYIALAGTFFSFISSPGLYSTWVYLPRYITMVHLPQLYPPPGYIFASCSGPGYVFPRYIPGISSSVVLSSLRTVSPGFLPPSRSCMHYSFVFLALVSLALLCFIFWVYSPRVYSLTLTFYPVIFLPLGTLAPNIYSSPKYILPHRIFFPPVGSLHPRYFHFFSCTGCCEVS